MNFFEHQDRARRMTGRLVILFTIAVIMILAAVNLAAWGVLRLTSPHVAYYQDAAPVFRGDLEYPGRQMEIDATWRRPEVYLYVTVGTLLVVVGGSLYKVAALSRGGHAVAQMLGGRLLAPNPTAEPERALQNVVEEMAIASGVPVPSIYVLNEESGINAFAAGFTAEDAVIGVTRGAIEKLSRDELQGVIAHEFSHILNGDMRLNLRLIGLLHGILVIGLIGYGLLRATAYTRPRRDSKGNNAVIVLLILGAALLVIGYVGVFFGRLIQSAVSRQREYLADASAVQFTRNPAGIAGALKKIGAYSSGSRLENHNAVEVAHMFFANGTGISFANLLATHPPLPERIRRVEPTWDGRFPSVSEIAPSPEAYQQRVARQPAERTQRSGGMPGVILGQLAQHAAEQVAAPRPQHVQFAADLLDRIPEQVNAAVHEPFGARAVIFSVLMDDRSDVRQAQLEALERTTDKATFSETTRLVQPIKQLGEEARLTLLDLALPALRQLSADQIQRFKSTVDALIGADQKVSLFEYALRKILLKNMAAPDQRARKPHVQYYALRPVMEDVVTLLAALASAGKIDPAQIERAFAAGAARLDGGQLAMPREPVRLSEVDQSLDRLAAAAPGVKRRVVEALGHCVAADGEVQVQEAELLRAIATTLDCPLPPFLVV